MLRWWWTRQLKSRDAGKRAQAVRKLGLLRAAAAIAPLARAMADEDPKVRREAALGLARLPDPRVIDVLIGALEGEDAVRRTAAAEGLRQTGSARAIDPLVARLADEDSRVRDAAGKAAWALGWRPADTGQQILYAVARKRFDEAAKAGPGATKALIVALEDGDSHVRKLAAKALAEVGDAQAVKALVCLTRDAVVAGHAVDALKSLLKDKANETSEEALQAAAHLSNVSQFMGDLRKVRTKGRAADVRLSGRRTVDCSEINHMARSELLRRGTAC